MAAAVPLQWNFSMNARGFQAGLDATVAKFKKDFRDRVERTVRFAHQSMISKTPVHTGGTVRNYIWSIQAPNTSGPLRPVNSGRPGATNKMALGQEPRRAANEAAATNTLNALSFNDPFKKFIVTNIGEAILGLEHGQYPHSPYTPRSPNGMVLVTLTEIMTRLAAGRL